MVKYLHPICGEPTKRIILVGFQREKDCSNGRILNCTASCDATGVIKRDEDEIRLWQCYEAFKSSNSPCSSLFPLAKNLFHSYQVIFYSRNLMSIVSVWRNFWLVGRMCARTCYITRVGRRRFGGAVIGRVLLSVLQKTSQQITKCHWMLYMIFGWNDMFQCWSPIMSQTCLRTVF